MLLLYKCIKSLYNFFPHPIPNMNICTEIRVVPNIQLAGYLFFYIRPDIRFHLPDIRPNIRLVE